MRNLLSETGGILLKVLTQHPVWHYISLWSHCTCVLTIFSSRTFFDQSFLQDVVDAVRFGLDGSTMFAVMPLYKLISFDRLSFSLRLNNSNRNNTKYLALNLVI